MADPDSPPETAHHLQQSSLNTSVASIRVNGSEGYKGVTEPSSEEAVQPSHAHQEENLDVTEINRRWEAIRQRRVARRAARAAAQPKNIRSTPQNILEDEVDRYDHKIWGFKIYRLTYDDDWKWQAFMEELVRQTRTNLERELKGSDLERLTSMLDWAAENDKTKWDGATLSQVRKHFKQLSEDEKPKCKSVGRYKVCLVVDKQSLESAFGNGNLRDEKTYLPHQSPFVKALNGTFNEEEARLERFKCEEAHYERVLQRQERGEEIRDEEWIYESIYPPDPLEVEYLKVPFGMVIPDLYHNLFDWGFEEVCEVGATPPKLWII